MATKSFLKDITIKSRKNCKNSVVALENAKYKKSKDVVVDCANRIATPEKIKKIFNFAQCHQ